MFALSGGRHAKSATPTLVDGKADASSRKLSRLERDLKLMKPLHLSLVITLSLNSTENSSWTTRETLHPFTMVSWHWRLVTKMKNSLFTTGWRDFCLNALKLLGSHSSEPTTVLPSDSSRVKLPKLDVPTSDGNILNWDQFWEQFTVSVHDHSNFSNAEKLVYLQQAIKGRSC